MKKYARERGFALVDILIVVCVLVIIGAIAWLAYVSFFANQNKEGEDTDDTTTSEIKTKPANEDYKSYAMPDGWKTFTNEALPFVFDHPANWEVQVNTDNPQVIIVAAFTDFGKKTQKAMTTILYGVVDGGTNSAINCVTDAASEKCEAYNNALTSGYITKTEPSGVTWSGVFQQKTIDASSDTTSLDEETFKLVVQSMRKQ